MKNKIEDLRNHLFLAMESVEDTDNPMDLERAKVIAELGQVIVNSAKAENEFLRITDSVSGTGFMPTDAFKTGPHRTRLVSLKPRDDDEDDQT